MIRVRHLLAAAFALFVMPAHSDAVTIKLCTLAPEGSPWHNVIRDMAETWTRETEREVRFRIYPGGVCGDEPVIVRKMRVGQVHAAALTGVGLGKIAAEFNALQMPMAFRSDAELNYVRDRLTPKFERLLEKKGFKFLTWGDAGWVQFFAKKPVIHPDDLKPMRLWVWAGDTAIHDAWKATGYRPIPLPVTEIHTALASGMIDAFSSTPVAALSFQWFGQAKHMTDLKWSPLPGAVIVTQRAWKKIPKEKKRKLLRITRDAGRRLNGMLPKLRAQALKVMQSHGLTVHHVPQKLIPEWEARVRAGYPKLLGDYAPATMFAEIQRLRDEYRAKKKNLE